METHEKVVVVFDSPTYFRLGPYLNTQGAKKKNRAIAQKKLTTKLRIASKKSRYFPPRKIESLRKAWRFFPRILSDTYFVGGKTVRPPSHADTRFFIFARRRFGTVECSEKLMAKLGINIAKVKEQQNIYWCRKKKQV